MNEIIFIDPHDLHPHEATDEAQARLVLESIAASGRFFPPLLVDLRTNVVLDGHHRLWASLALKCKRIPCYCVDYLADDSVVLESWRPDTTVTKRQVIEMGLSEETFPLKTTRHIYTMPDGVEPYPLSVLMGV